LPLLLRSHELLVLLLISVFCIKVAGLLRRRLLALALLGPMIRYEVLMRVTGDEVLLQNIDLVPWRLFFILVLLLLRPFRSGAILLFRGLRDVIRLNILRM